MSMTALAVLTAESEAHHQEGIDPWVVGLVSFGILVLLLVALLAFAGGREHS